MEGRRDRIMKRCMEVAKQLMLDNKGYRRTEEVAWYLQCVTVEDANCISEEIMSLQAFEDDDQLANRPPPGSVRYVDEDDVDDEAGYYNQEPVVCISNGAWINESF